MLCPFLKQQCTSQCALFFPHKNACCLACLSDDADTIRIMLEAILKHIEFGREDD